MWSCTAGVNYTTKLKFSFFPLEYLWRRNKSLAFLCWISLVIFYWSCNHRQWKITKDKSIEFFHISLLKYLCSLFFFVHLWWKLYRSFNCKKKVNLNVFNWDIYDNFPNVDLFPFQTRAREERLGEERDGELLRGISLCWISELIKVKIVLACKVVKRR